MSQNVLFQNVSDHVSNSLNEFCVYDTSYVAHHTCHMCVSVSYVSQNVFCVHNVSDLGSYNLDKFCVYNVTIIHHT